MAHRGSEEEAGYCCYTDVPSGNSPNIQTHHLVNQLQSFESNPEIYNLTTGMEMIGFFSKTGSGGGGCGPSSSKPINESITSGHFYQHHDDHEHIMTTTSSADETMMAAPPDHHSTTAAWHGHHHHHHEDQIQNRLMMQVEDSSSLRCVFPCEGNERPSQGLSLSLSSTNPSTIGLQSFELRRQDDIRFPSSSSRSDIGFFGKSMNIHQQQHLNIEDGFLGKSANLHHHGQFQIRNSSYLGPAQELLNEFCNLGTKQTMDPKPKIKSHKTSHQWQLDENATTTSSSKKQSLYNLELLDLQRRKAKLLSMLEEVDRRYRHYCDQMKAVVSSFEAVAGDGAASVYSALASKAMSRHFRCLRDGIVGQITATKTAMGDKDTAVAPGATRGETPRLKLLDQTLRQQRAFQQMNMMETHPWRPQRGLPERSVSVLRAWLFEHFLHPYPSDVDKHILARQTGLSRSQVSNWFINARVRLWKPMVEEMYLTETKEQDSPMITSTDDHDNGRPNQIAQIRPEDQKPAQDQLVRIDSECLSSIINNPEKKEINNKHNKSPQIQQPDNLQHHHQHSFGRVVETFGAVELDFSSYNQHTSGGGALSYDANENAHRSFGGGGGGGGGAGVSLTLGLNQHGGSGVSLAFSPTSQNSSPFYPRDQIEDCQPVQYSLLDGEGQNLPYRNLMGAQLLHDLAG